MQSFGLLAAVLLSAGLLVSAHPGHGNSDLVQRKVLNATTGAVGVSNNTDDAKDHVPTFKTTCVCPAAACENDSRLSAKSRCSCKQQNLLACYMKTDGGCPKPADKTCT